jgi:ABC-type glycerol-3-phosphate transport system permease component
MKRRRVNPSTIISLLILSFFAAVTILPIIYILNSAFKPLREVFLYPPTFFVRSPTLNNFVNLFMSADPLLVPFSRYLFNSMFVSVVFVFLSVTISSMCAYPLSKHKFPGRNGLFSLIIVSLMFVAQTVSITRYIVVSSLGITDTYLAHILPYLAMPVAVFLIKQFMDVIPDSLIEAAKLDGASEMGIFLRICVPLARAAIGAVIIIAFQTVWLSDESSKLYTTIESLKTIRYYVSSIFVNDSSAVRNGAANAGSLLIYLPAFILFVFMQNNMMDAMVHSGIK